MPIGYGGVIFRTGGDSICAAFASPTEAVRAALDGQLALWREPWGDAGPIKVRMGLHTGEVEAGARSTSGCPSTTVPG